MKHLSIDGFAGGGGASCVALIVKEQIGKGVISLHPDGTFWKNARITNSGRIVPIEPKRMEVNLKAGYLGIVVWKHGKQYLALAHRVAWILLKGNIPDHMDINHKDGNKHNNNPENLEVVTRGTNLYHAYRTGLRKKSNYSEEYSKQAKQLRDDGLTYNQIGEALGISQTSAFKAANHDAEGNPYPIKEQVAKIGNSVVPIMAAAIAKANLEAE